jgi:hypothetical protein
MTALLHLSSPSHEAPDCPDTQPAHFLLKEHTSSPPQQLSGLFGCLPVANPLRIKQLLSLFAVAFVSTRIVHRPSSYAPQVSSPEKTTTQTHTQDSALTTHALDGDCFLILHLYFGILSLYHRCFCFLVIDHCTSIERSVERYCREQGRAQSIQAKPATTVPNLHPSTPSPKSTSSISTDTINTL